MTRKEMITKCVENQIERGVVKPERKERQIQARLTGCFKMSKRECQEWYDEVFNR